MQRPVLHANVLASLFGWFPFESAQRPAFSYDTNPWAQQLYDDVQQLVRFDGGSALACILHDDFSKIFTECRTDFLYIDVSQFRAEFFSVSIPPPGWVPDTPHVQPPLEQVEEEMPFECECLLDDGSFCGRKFETLQQLATHMRRSKTGNHGLVPPHFKAVVTNQCPWCRAVYCNMRTARAHVKMALQHKVCRGSGSQYTFKPKDPISLECPMCQIVFDSLHDLHDHITQHFAGPWRHVD